MQELEYIFFNSTNLVQKERANEKRHKIVNELWLCFGIYVNIQNKVYCSIREYDFNFLGSHISNDLAQKSYLLRFCEFIESLDWCKSECWLCLPMNGIKMDSIQLKIILEIVWKWTFCLIL